MLYQGHSLHPDCALCPLHLHGQQAVARSGCVRRDRRVWLQEVLRGPEQGAGGAPRQVRTFIFSEYFFRIYSANMQRRRIPVRTPTANTLVKVETRFELST